MNKTYTVEESGLDYQITGLGKLFTIRRPRLPYMVVSFVGK
jgi:hypothetical protein